MLFQKSWVGLEYKGLGRGKREKTNCKGGHAIQRRALIPVLENGAISVETSLDLLP